MRNFDQSGSKIQSELSDVAYETSSTSRSNLFHEIHPSSAIIRVTLRLVCI